MKVSIVIPTYNSEKTILETVNSALQQTYENIEIIIVDDHSKDKTLSLIHQFKSNKIEILQNRGSGASSARNTGILHSKGDYVQFLDSDDLLKSDKIENQIKSLVPDSQYTLISGRWGRFVDDIKNTVFADNPLYDIQDPIEWVACNLKTASMMHPGAWLVSKHLIEKSGLWDESLSLNDDGEFFIRVAINSERIKHCNEAVSFYRSQIKGSLSGQTSWRALYSKLRSLELSRKELLQKNDSDQIRLALADAFKRFSFEAYPIARDLFLEAETRCKELGGSSVKPAGGRKFELMSKLIGWKLASRLRRFYGNVYV